jgi:hypothetical protein
MIAMPNSAAGRRRGDGRRLLGRIEGHSNHRLPYQHDGEGGEVIPQDKWKWFGNAGHLICSHDCRFHLCTLIGNVLVSTVGQYFPDATVREILAESRKITLQGRGDDRKHDYMKKIGYEEIGCDRKFETMAFKVSEKVCTAKDCNCGMPEIVPTEIEMEGYNTAGEATKGHMRICMKVAARRRAKEG